MTRPDFSALLGLNAAYAERVYEQYLEAPGSVPEEWRQFFERTLPPEQHAQVKAEPVPAPVRAEVPAGGELQALTGVAGRIVRNMEDSLAVPTATSTREVPVKVLEENRHLINLHRQGLYLSKISFTHVIAWAVVQACKRVPAMAQSYEEQDGKPFRRTHASFNLGLAIDLPGKDGRRSLVVPNVKDAGSLSFRDFLSAYGQVVDKARAGKLTADDFAGTTATLTNPGTIGTMSSLPRLMAGQGFIVATGAITVPAAFQGAAPQTLTELGVSKVMTLTSTYDHRVIQGAESGQFLDWMHKLLTGEENFYEDLFASLKVPYRPLRFTVDRRPALGSSLREAENLERAARAMTYIRSYRVRGYLLAALDPLKYEPKHHPELDAQSYGLTIWDKDREFFSAGVTDKPFATLREIQETLHATYTRHIGVEFMHIADPEERRWLQQRMEGNRNEEELPREVMLRVLDKLVEAESFERFLHTRFVGHKRFSLEGGDTLIPVLDALLERASGAVQRVVLGMAHRGRLNVLANILKKPLVKIFGEFEGFIDPDSPQGSGDVKYHLGATGTHVTAAGASIELELACNPSHLEAVDPVVEGMARARQDLLPREQRSSVLPVLIHGDAAFSGQGVVAETLQMSQLRGYRTGGTVHVVVNNQIGYTTGPEDSRSSQFCTDLARAIQAPIFHVNGDDPLAAVRMIRLAFDYRMHTAKDVVLDVVCYRRHGHNEGDEPSFTQPLLYRAIEAHPPVRAIYQDFLLRAGVLQQAEVERYDGEVQAKLRAALEEVRGAEGAAVSEYGEEEQDGWEVPVPAVPAPELRQLIDKQLEWPETFHPHPKVKGILERRADMLAGGQPIDFATAEALAFASLLVHGVPVRLAGQDSARGTFSQRHSVLIDHENGSRFVPLNHLRAEQARYTVVDSLLSEEAALGFEYGYSTLAAGLTMWEAQFGDFNNGAQVHIDQFLAAGEAKWYQASGLVLLLPHGYDGQGPEHSSARLERFLQLCAENNLRVANCSTAAQYFHLLRAQALDPVKKPLVVMTPKSLLRLKVAGSTPEELARGSFAPVLDDPSVKGRRVERVVCCSGKVYYDLLEARGKAPVALVRAELLYPWPRTRMAELRRRHPGAKWVWCQEEPANMGAWSHVRQLDEWHEYAGRRAAASPATGSLQRHKQEQQELVAQALALPAAAVKPVEGKAAADAD